MDKKKIELLAPAKDTETANAAIKCGADAVYIGAPRFSARQAADNSIDNIKQVVEFAHQYYAKVYVALNTLLFDNELPAAEKMINQFYKIGIDGLMIQDMSLLELDLPPIPLIASTQMNNASFEKVKFLQNVGFFRAILARELTLEQIKDIRKHTTIELECFIHGALCVGASGQCYISYSNGGRSGNRGVCAQPCRRLYSLKDKTGKTIVKDRYLLSLKDLNLSDKLEELIDAGVNAFKIEGRLKEISYVANVVGFYRQKLDAILAKKGLQKSSSGKVSLNFKSDLNKTFNRGYTDYGITGKGTNMGSINTPKSIGEFVGIVSKVDKNAFTIEGKSKLHNGDGICFFDERNNLDGTTVNNVEGGNIYPQKLYNIRTGMKIYRNSDHEFNKLIETNPAQRKILISLILRDTTEGIMLIAKDCDNSEATIEIKTEKTLAQKKETAKQTITTQLQKLGNTIFEATGVSIETCEIYFFPVSVLNEFRRKIVQKLLEVRENNRVQNKIKIEGNNIPYPEKQLSYLSNVLNKKAQAFYERHGVETIEPAAESNIDLNGKALMFTKYCIKQELGLCEGKKRIDTTGAMFLEDEDGRQFKVEFNCDKCGMTIYQGLKQ
ncbi:MAG: U32 family peptidase [Candidatus Omnitrophica bacterium]|nr:U32 family peptidase [Candidatus Omnitrophota bacterium]MBU1048104.1 U32 family peptidase [Candidatus Omnitrophota bacterium]MBU1767466.1 U32 family peptidase [Candidatus Omnitrophota bacterium]MBU1889194.1 U32 family peptidase [Candidatus Omnitrophota bacterium]